MLDLWWRHHCIGNRCSCFRSYKIFTLIVKPSFVIFDIRALWRSGMSVRVPGCQKLQITLRRWIDWFLRFRVSTFWFVFAWPRRPLSVGWLCTRWVKWTSLVAFYVHSLTSMNRVIWRWTAKVSVWSPTQTTIAFCCWAANCSYSASSLTETPGNWRGRNDSVITNSHHSCS